MRPHHLEGVVEPGGLLRVREPDPGGQVLQAGPQGGLLSALVHGKVEQELGESFESPKLFGL